MWAQTLPGPILRAEAAGATLNPAQAGQSGSFSATVVNTNYWIRVNDFPKTLLLRADAPITAPNKTWRIGLGGISHADLIGDMGILTAYAGGVGSVSYAFADDHRLGLGFGMGLRYVDILHRDRIILQHPEPEIEKSLPYVAFKTSIGL
jgi:hypothetical protein